MSEDPLLIELHRIWPLSRAATLLGAKNPSDCVVPGHAYFIGDRWVGPPYEVAWRTYAKAGLAGECQCGWVSPSVHRDTWHWTEHLLATLTTEEWGAVEDEVTLRALGRLPLLHARSWHVA